MMMTNEKQNKCIKKYRSDYWSTNQIDDDIFKQIRDCSDSDQLLLAAKIMKYRQLKITPYNRPAPQIQDSSGSEEDEEISDDSELVEYDLHAPILHY